MQIYKDKSVGGDDEFLKDNSMAWVVFIFFLCMRKCKMTLFNNVFITVCALNRFKILLLINPNRAVVYHHKLLILKSHVLINSCGRQTAEWVFNRHAIAKRKPDNAFARPMRYSKLFRYKSYYVTSGRNVRNDRWNKACQKTRSVKCMDGRCTNGEPQSRTEKNTN